MSKRRAARWLPWLLGAAGVAAVVLVFLRRAGSTVMSAVAVDAASFHVACVINLAAALALLTARGHASPLAFVLAALSLVSAGRSATRLFRAPSASGCPC